MKIVIDASVAIKWFVPEQDSPKAVKLLSEKLHLLAPDLIRPEVANILWKLHAKRLLSGEEASQILEDFLACPIEIYNNDFIVTSAFEIAAATGRTVYDSLYLALAIEKEAVLITADLKFVNALKNTDLSRFIKILT